MAWGDVIDLTDSEPEDSPKEREGITLQEYNAVRALLLNTLTESQISNEMIADKTYFGSALDDVNRLLGTNVPSPDSPNFSKYRTAVLLMTASYMCEAVAELSNEGIAVIRRGFHDTNWESKRKNLEMRALAEIDKLLPTIRPNVAAERLIGRRGTW